jgi:hypothetical protein
MDGSFRCLAVILVAAGCGVPALFAADETELKDEAGKTIVHYIVEAPANVAPAGTTDPARQVGVIFCFQEHISPPGADIFPVRESLRRLGLSDHYVLLAIRAQSPRGGLGEADFVPIEKLLAWAEKNYPVNPRRIYMFGKGAGGMVAGEFTMLHPRSHHRLDLLQLGLVGHALRAGKAVRYGEQRSGVLHGAGNARFHAPYHDGARYIRARQSEGLPRHLSRV